MPVWKRIWLVFTAIWVVVSALNAFTILAFAEDTAPDKLLWPVFIGITVPAALYLIGWLWELFRSRKR